MRDFLDRVTLDDISDLEVFKPIHPQTAFELGPDFVDFILGPNGQKVLENEGLVGVK